MANITERQTKSGVAYRIRVSAGYDDNYTQIMRSMTYKPKPGMSQRQIKTEVNRQAVLFEEKVRQEQAEKKKRIEMGLDDDLSLSAKRVRFEPLAEEWLNLMETTHEMKPATIIHIKTMRERTYKAIGNVYVDVLNYRHIQKFITSLAQKGVNKHTGGGLSQKTQKHYVTFISDVINYARTCGLVDDNPCTRVKTVKTDKKEKEIYSLDELKILLMRINEKADLQHRVMFNLLAYCGMRRGELMGLEFKDIDFENNTLEIVRTSNYQNGETCGYGIYEDGKLTIPIPYVIPEKNWCSFLKKYDWKTDCRLYYNVKQNKTFDEVIADKLSSMSHSDERLQYYALLVGAEDSATMYGNHQTLHNLLPGATIRDYSLKREFGYEMTEWNTDSDGLYQGIKVYCNNGDKLKAPFKGEITDVNTDDNKITIRKDDVEYWYDGTGGTERDTEVTIANAVLLSGFSEGDTVNDGQEFAKTTAENVNFHIYIDTDGYGWDYIDPRLVLY